MRIEDGVDTGEMGRMEIPNCTRDDLPKFLVDRGCKEGVEVGLYRGAFARKLCDAGLKVHGIDPYLQYEDYHPDRKGYKARNEEIYHEAWERMKGYDCTVIRKTSMDAVKDFEDESLDFVYIDGNHQLKYVVEDIHAWLPKLKKGGVMSGHDYGYFKGKIHARFAVDAYVMSYEIKPWYVIGSSTPKKGEKRDDWRSWFWIKE